ncbi:MAG TPA: SDR family oxidoreductase [Kofleriaceae bacterium]|nr:SDR family oxidoreductase [Kofleriaceae bacterium]
MKHRTPTILLTGASGYVGRLLAAALLERESHTKIVAPVRAKHDPERLRAALETELMIADPEARARALARIEFVSLPPTGLFATELVPHLLRELRDHDVVDIVHSAGCLSYFNEAKLHDGNEQLTSLMLELAQALSVEKFVYISTAFSSGYVDGAIPETLHSDPESDPNAYTRSKRRTERIVAGSGIPFQIHRPSAVVGRSHDGFYSGKVYGGYQIWSGACRFLCDRHRSELHIVAPDVPINFVHQEAVQAGFHAAFRTLPAGAIVHLVSRQATLPTTRDFWQAWIEACGRPDTVYYYDRLDQLDRDAIDEQQRLMVEFAESNIEITTHDWQFATGALDALRAAGLRYPDVTPSSIVRCLDWFLATTPRAQAFMASEAARRDGRPTRVVEVSGTGGVRAGARVLADVA